MPVKITKFSLNSTCIIWIRWIRRDAGWLGIATGGNREYINHAAVRGWFRVKPSGRSAVYSAARSDTMPQQQYINSVTLTRHYRRASQVVRALDEVSLTVSRGEFLGIVGSSGSGKTTLLNLLAGLDTPTSGTIEVDGMSLTMLSRRQLSAYRAARIGMIFQSFNLISHYTALQNVEAALLFNGTSQPDRQRRAQAVLEQLGLSDRLHHRPSDLSGGEQQRVAVGRAIVKQPEILFADEPTGNLDHDNSDLITSLLMSLNQKGLTVILVTHNLEMVEKLSHRTIQMHYGKMAGTGVEVRGSTLR